ncbi:uncharacterized protein LOC134291220 [Aedes albopictus]|uniref:Lian-aa1 retrotransposon protein n=1 Tax=Aedes albopictus TaxID=7160 RepID=A0ABM2A7E5_AEDAL
MSKRGFDGCIVNWIGKMLSEREISSNLGSSFISVRAVKGCPQGGVLSPLLWSLVVDDLLKQLEAQGFEIIGFADDIVIVVRGKYDHIFSNRMQTALNLVTSWCDKEGLNVNPSKTTVVPFTRKRQISITNLKLKGTLLELSSTVKYLGIHLDSKLNWNLHLEQVIGKATNALWISKKTFGKKWGLKPKMIYWIYTAIVRPRVTYASLIWWPKTNEKLAQKKLEKLQRLAGLSITGAMRSTPTKALDTLLFLLPLHQFVQLEATKSALKVKRTTNLFEGDLRGHLSILKSISINSLITSNSDWMSRRYNFERTFEVINPGRYLWTNGGPELHPGSIVFYTDGSKLNDQVGAGVTGPGINVSIPMGKWPTVFQAEIQAILECCNICLRRNYRYSKICIMSDSQAALNALKSATCSSKLVWECILSLQQLACRNQVKLFWVPGHCGIDGNEQADMLARLGSSHQFIGPEPFCGVSGCSLRMEFKTWEHEKIISNWENTTFARQSKRFIKPNFSNTRKILELSKTDLSTFTGLLTGHCPSRYHMKLIGKLQNDVCRFCDIDTEDSEHLLCRCPAIAVKRIRFFDKGLIEPLDVWRTNPNTVVQFIRAVSPCWDQTHSQGLIIANSSNTST